MPNYRRNRIPGGTYFFTVNLLERKSGLLVKHIGELREAVRVVRDKEGRRADKRSVIRQISKVASMQHSGIEDHRN
jgi:REP element-mobilizing transposase RayT